MCGPEPIAGTPASRMRGRCSCGADGVVFFEEKTWCALCADVLLGTAPARAWSVLARDRIQARGRRIEVLT